MYRHKIYEADIYILVLDNNYDHPMIEDGVLLKDMIYLKREICHSI